MAIKKSARGGTKVLFELPSDIGAREVYLCGDFNDWAPDATRLRRHQDGRFSVTLPLEPGSYRYRFLIDGERWENDWSADDYPPNDYGGHDSLITV